MYCIQDGDGDDDDNYDDNDDDDTAPYIAYETMTRNMFYLRYMLNSIYWTGILHMQRFQATRRNVDNEKC